MKYFEYICFLIFFAAIFAFILFFRQIKIHHFYKLAWKSILKRQQKSSDLVYRPSFYLFNIVKKLAFNPAPDAKKALKALVAGRLKSVSAYFSQHKNSFYAMILEAFYEPEKALAKMESEIRQDPFNYKLLVELASLYFILGNKSKCKLCLDNIDEKKLNSYCLGKAKYYQSFYDVNDGDMLSASQNCSKAIRQFHKNKAFYEEALAYLQMGIIYRTAVVSDVAQVMMETALDIFSNIACLSGQSETYGNLGMLMAIQKRFEEAEDFYEKANKICTSCHNKQAQAEIINQQALLYLLQNNYEKAQNFAQTALDIHNFVNNPRGVAFSKDLLANIKWNQKNYSEAVHFAFEAKNLYKQDENFSAYFETVYLIALILYEQKKLSDAEKLLRDIISLSQKHSSNFHIANAYNLLGLIFLQRHDLRRAKGLFQQSLDLEQVNNRLSGIATDYVNIGTIELTKGNISQAQKTLKTALEYAAASGDEELIEILRQRVDTLLKT